MGRPVCSAMASAQLSQNDVDLVCGQGFSTHSQSSPRSQKEAIYCTRDLISLSVQGALTDVSSDCNPCGISNKKNINHYNMLQIHIPQNMKVERGTEAKNVFLK